MKSFLITLFLFALHLFSAQEEVYANGVFNFEENKTQKIFTDQTRVRQQPNVNSQILDSLQSNQQVLIIKKDETILQLGERNSNWYKVSYQRENKTLEGYVWGANLCIGYRNKNGYDFLFGISKTIDKKDKKFNQDYKQNIASVKAVDGNSLIDEVFFETGSGESLSYGTFNIESNHKLQNVDFTLKAIVSGEACGIAGYDQYILFRDKKLIALPQ
ncbi:MAG TPA: SH3 domain-containing protein, partial [Flavobacterium sp.]|nr:SH3 domain-containing protein [Flavobacterium sp.]